MDSFPDFAWLEVGVARQGAGWLDFDDLSHLPPAPWSEETMAERWPTRGQEVDSRG